MEVGRGPVDGAVKGVDEGREVGPEGKLVDDVGEVEFCRAVILVISKSVCLSRRPFRGAELVFAQTS